MSSPLLSPRGTVSPMAPAPPAASSPPFRNMFPTHSNVLQSGSPSQGSTTTTNPFTTPTTLSMSDRPTATRRVRSDERHNRTKRSLQSYGSPVRQPKRRAADVGQSTARARSFTGVPYPAIAENPNEPYPLGVDGLRPVENHDRPTPYTTILRPVTRTAQAVHEELKRRVRRDVSVLGKSGFVYILRDPARPGFLKIGSSMDTGQRWKKIERDCGLEVEEVFVSDEVDSCQRAEHLAQGDLWHLCCPYRCASCRREHREWHKIDEKLATDTVKRWVKFMKKRPYTQAGKLKPIWQKSLDRGRLSRRGDGSLDHDTRWKHWHSVLLQPRYYDYCEDHFESYWAPWWKFSWQISTVFSWAIMYLNFRDVKSLLLLVISIFCSFAHVFTSKLSSRSKR